MEFKQYSKYWISKKPINPTSISRVHLTNRKATGSCHIIGASAFWSCQRILLPPAGNTGCYTTAKASWALHRENLSEILQKRHLWSQQNFSITLLLSSLSSCLRVTQRNPPFLQGTRSRQVQGWVHTLAVKSTAAPRLSSSVATLTFP